MNHLIRRAVTVPAATALLLLTAGAASGSPAGAVHHAGSCRGAGDYATCVASGTAYNPRTIAVHVTSSPGQGVQVYWDMVCSKGDGAGSKSGHFTARTPLRRTLRHPYVRPDSCDVSADAQLATGGRLHVWITYRH